MTIKRTLTTITAAVALAATTLAPMATSASAEPWNGHRDSYGMTYRGDLYRANRGDFNRSNRGNWEGRGRDGGRHDFYAYRRHKDHTGKYIALGIGALMLGIMASEASHY